MVATTWPPRDADPPRVFYLARWIAALFLLGGPLLGASALFMVWLAVTARDPVALLIMGVTAVVLVPLALGSMWYAMAAIRRRPMFRIDGRGMVWGGDWDRDLAVEWQNVRRLRVRTVVSNGIVDMQIVPDLFDERPVRSRAHGLRRRGTVIGNSIYFGAPLGVSTVYLQGGYDAVIEAIQRHYRGPIEEA